MVAEIPVYGGKGAKNSRVIAHALVDDDWAHLAEMRWYLDKDDYVIRMEVLADGRRRGVKLHRLVLGLTPGDGQIGDHEDGNRLDNRRSNLRVTTVRGNAQNRSKRKTSRSRYRGVSWVTKVRKWQAAGHKDGRNVYLGQYDDEDEAGEVARQWRLQHMPDSIRDVG